MRRSSLLSGLLFGASLAWSFGGAGPAQAQDKPPIKIGISLIGSGHDADYYKRQQIAGAQTAIDVANEKGGVNGRKVVSILEDNKADATTGAAIAHKLIDIDKVDTIFIEPTPPTLATLPIAEAAKLLVISGAQTPKLALSPWGSSASPDATVSGPAIAKLALALKGQRIAMLTEDNDSVAISVTKFKAVINEAKVPIVAAETFKGASVDFMAQLTKIRVTQPDVLFLFTAGAQAYGYALKQMGELNFRPKYILTYGPVTDPQVRQIAGNLIEGVYYIRLPIDQTWNDTIFKKRNGYDADTNGAIAYDAIGIYLAARAQAGSDDQEKVRQTMFNLKGYKGAMGAWGFNGTGASQVQYEAAQLHADGSTTRVPF